jgi:hypothetical protein
MRKYTQQQFEEAIASSNSYAEVCKKLGLSPAGGNYQTIKKKARELGLSIAHMKGQAWSRGLRLDGTHRETPIEDVLVNGRATDSNTLRKRLIKQGYKSQKCEICSLTEWLGQPIPLELDHVDGDKFNNLLSNLRIVCPNCHALTSTFRGKNINK